MKYRVRNPKTIEAFQHLINGETTHAIPAWFLEAIRYGFFVEDEYGLRLRKSNTTINNTDWIVKGADGHLSILSDQLFQETYEPAE